jgi:hypothetical protein
MPQSMTVNEYQSSIWKNLTGVSVLITIIFGAAFLFTNNTLWAGIFRLLAFAGFAGVVLAALRLREKPVTLNLETNNKHLIVRYMLKNKELKEELFEREAIKNIEKKEVSKMKNFLSKSDAYKYVISFTDTDTRLSMLTNNGRDLHLSRQASAQVDAFLAANDIPFSKNSCK